MSKAVLLIGNVGTKSVLRLKEEADLLGITLDCVFSKKISFAHNRINVSGTDVSKDPLDYDTYYFRAIHHDKAQNLQRTASFLYKKKKRVVERCFVDGLLPNDKIVSPSRGNFYKVPETQIVKHSEIEEVSLTASFPLVAKKFNSSLGKGIRRIASKEELLSFSHNVHEDFIIQEYFDITYDTRILVIDGEVLGGVHRYKKNDKDFLTTLKGGVRENATLSELHKKAAAEAAKLQGLEIAGIDLFTIDGAPYVIEVNASPQFRVFETYTGVNVAKKILEYIV